MSMPGNVFSKHEARRVPSINCCSSAKWLKYPDVRFQRIAELPNSVIHETPINVPISIIVNLAF
jgi:hypothetical protein